MECEKTIGDTSVRTRNGEIEIRSGRYVRVWTVPPDGEMGIAQRRHGVVGDEGLCAETADGAIRAWAFPDWPGSILEAQEAPEGPGGRGADEFAWTSSHVRIVELSMRDQTDCHNELLWEREWVLWPREAPFSLTCPAMAVEDALTGEGRVFLRLAPLPHARQGGGEATSPSGVEEASGPAVAESVPGSVEQKPDFEILPREGKARILRTGYPVAEIAYEGGRIGRIRALHSVQRRLRRYESGRDGLFLSNTWGDRSRDRRICEAFLLREIEAGAALGVDVVEIDDGWEKGRTLNSAEVADGRRPGTWDGYWAFDGRFWDPDPKRFPNGLKPVVAAAKARGMRFGLWFGPDSSDEAANWRRDADRLLELHRETGIDFIKVDSMKTHSALSLRRQRMLFDRVLTESNGGIVIDLDVTAEIRPGYFGLPDIGTVFVENRYTDHGSYWPHLTLRSLWSLAHAVDPVRLRMEVLNPLRNRERYGDDPLAPARYRADTLFAIAMVGSPLGWFEISNLAPETVAEMRPLVAVWKRERARFHGGDIVPIGDAPDGLAWTGFVSVDASGSGGSVLLFRERNARADHVVDLSELLPGASSCAVLVGRGTARLDGASLAVAIPSMLDYLWVRVESHA